MRYALLSLLLAGATALHAQPRPVTLAALFDAAAARDARSHNVDLLAEASALRLGALRAQWLPQIGVTGQATYQSSAPTLPIALPGMAAPSSPLERFLAQAELQQTLYDGGRTGRQMAVEQAALLESQAGVAMSLYALKGAVAEAFFGALLAGAREEVLALQEADLTARLTTLKAREASGAALPADTAALAAERLRVWQARLEARAQQQGARAVLVRLTGTPLTPNDSLVLPSAGASWPSDAAVGARPELEKLTHAADRVAAEARLARVAMRPHVAVFGQAGVGRPVPFEPFGDATQLFGLVGARLNWTVFDGGRARREAQAREVQARTLANDADAFREQVLREAEDEIADLARFDQTLDADRRAVALREEVARVARRQFEEGVLLPSDYAARLNSLAEARLSYEQHRIERARAAVRLALTLGLPVHTP